MQANDLEDTTTRGTDGDLDPSRKTIRVTVTNVDEAGEVTLPTLQPQEGVEITATHDGCGRQTYRHHI